VKTNIGSCILPYVLFPENKHSLSTAVGFHLFRKNTSAEQFVVRVFLRLNTAGGCFLRQFWIFVISCTNCSVTV